MKRYVPIIIGVVALVAILFIGSDSAKKDADLTLQEGETSSMVTSFAGSVTKVFEGDNVLQYGFDLPETATTSVEKDGALVKVTDAGLPVLAMYLSFEGGRGYSPADYITNNIVPHVAAVTDKGVVTIGAHEWTVAESEWSVWHVAKSTDGQWLLVVENKKTDAEKAEAIIKTVLTK